MLFIVKNFSSKFIVNYDDDIFENNLKSGSEK